VMSKAVIVPAIIKLRELLLVTAAQYQIGSLYSSIARDYCALRISASHGSTKATANLNASHHQQKKGFCRINHRAVDSVILSTFSIKVNILCSKMGSIKSSIVGAVFGQKESLQ
jgi:hypothetical protein